MTTPKPRPMITWLHKCLDEIESDNTPLLPQRDKRGVLNPEQRYILADMPAKRRVISRHLPVGDSMRPACGGCPRGTVWPCPEIRDAASVFADRAGYRKEWKPDD